MNKKPLTLGDNGEVLCPACGSNWIRLNDRRVDNRVWGMTFYCYNCKLTDDSKQFPLYTLRIEPDLSRHGAVTVAYWKTDKS